MNMAIVAVQAFLEEQNRPFSVLEIQNGVKGTFGKAAIQKGLDTLAQGGTIKEKVYGKQKVYHIMQSSEGTSEQTKETLLEIDRKINETALNLKEVHEKVKENLKHFEQSKRKVSLPQALEQKVKLETEIENIKKELQKFEGVEIIHPTEKKKVQDTYDEGLNLYRKRKRMCMDILNSILENYPKSKKQLFEDIGIETDEDAGFSLEKI